MPLWQIIAAALLFLVALVIPLGSRWHKGCALALLGAILGGGGALGAGWYYLNHYYVKPRPRNDSDWTGLETVLLCLVAFPVVGVIAGFFLGMSCAYWLQQWTDEE